MSESTTWSIEPHTLAKHQILRGYLDAWLPITTRYNSRVLYIDGFAGPGRYRDGEDGSPIIALKAALEHHYPMSAEIIYLFIEVDARRSANLRQEIARLSLPPNIQVHVQQGRFDETISDLLDHLGGSAARLAPTFAFIDPFGWTGAPFSIIQRLLARQRCEVLVNLMYEEVNRFLALPRQADNWNRLFGTSGWEHVLGAGDAIERQQRVHDLYEHQMRRNAGARFVID